jgi:hypothetical protein
MEVVGGQEPHLDAGERDQRVRWRACSRWPSEVLVDSEIVLVVTGPSSPRGIARFGELVGEAARPIDDVRGTAAYRVHALGVLACRTLAWAWDEYRDRRS